MATAPPKKLDSKKGLWLAAIYIGCCIYGAVTPDVRTGKVMEKVEDSGMLSRPAIQLKAEDGYSTLIYMTQESFDMAKVGDTVTISRTVDLATITQRNGKKVAGDRLK